MNLTFHKLQPKKKGLNFPTQPQQPQQLQQQPPQQQPNESINPQFLQPNQNQQSIIVTASPDPKPKAHYNEAMLLTSDYLHDSAFLPSSTYKQSSSSSIAGTIGSNANYSDSEASSHSYYRGNSLGSNSSIAPSVTSLTSSSIISNISGNSSNSSSSTTSSNSHGYSNQNHHRINTQQAMASNFNNSNRNHHHGHNRSGGSIASSSATDISSVYSSVPSQSIAVDGMAGMSDDMLYSGLILPGQQQSQVQDQRSYHPYRR